MATNSKLDELKKNVVEILQGCDGYRLDLSKFKMEYKRLFGKEFNHRLYGLKKKTLASTMQEIGDVISMEPGALKKSVDIILKEAYIPLRNHCSSSPVQDTMSLQENIAELGCCPVDAKDENAPEENERSVIPWPACENPSLELWKSPCSPPVVQRVAGHLPGQVPTLLMEDEQRALVGNAASMIHHSPLLGILGPPPSLVTFSSHSPLPSMCRNASPVPSYEQQHDTPLQSAEAGENLPTSPLSFQEIMTQQLEEEEEKSTVASPVGSNNARVRKVGKPGPFEDSFTKAQEIQASLNRRKPKRNITLGEVDRTAQDIISGLSEEGSYVSLEVVKAKLCKEFGQSSIKALGFRKDVDIPALQELIKLQAKVSLFVHAYVMSNSIATLYELNQSIADMESKSEFQDLRLGPLVKQPVVYDLFKAPQDLSSIPHVTTIQILKHLENYMKKEDLWRKKVSLEKFLQYLCEEYRCDTPYYLGVRIKSMGLSISVIKQAKRTESERWKTARETVSKEMDAEIVKRLRKIKKDLLGQEPGDLRSCIMKFLDASPVDILNEVFNCCLELFEGQRQKRTSKFFAMVTGDSLGRQLFQLALHTACRRLVGPIPEEACAGAALVKPPDKNKTKGGRKKELIPPSAGELVDEVNAWLAKADTLDLARLARIESNVVSKFPNFTGFEEFGHGSFLHFLTKHDKLGQALEEVGGMVRAGREGLCLGLRVSLDSVLDFILQCGTQASPEAIQKTLCTYYGVTKVTDLGFGSFARLREKADERRKSTSGGKVDSIVYEAALLCNDAVKRNDGTSGEESHNGAVLGWKGKEEALNAIQSTPLLEDVALWTQWDDVFGGEVSGLGKLPSFLENERILMSVGKNSSRKRNDIVVIETSPGMLLRVATDTSPDIFHRCVSVYDALGTAGHLVSMVIVNGGVSNTPTALLANHVHSSLASLASSATSAEFVLNCLIRIPHRLAASVGAKVLLEPLKELAGSTEAPELLISSCKTQFQRSRLHQLGFALGVNKWIEDYQRRVSSIKEDQRDVVAHQNKKQTRPIGLVKPVSAHAEHFDQKQHFEESVGDFSTAATVVDDTSSFSTDNPPKLAQVYTPDVRRREKCKALIEQIRREDFGIGFELGEEVSKVVNKQREREGRGLHRLSTELYSRDTHFVLELVQNADDNNYPEECNPSLVFILESDKIVVLNNERGFEEKNIRALCDVGRSTKGAHRYGYIGQKGIGFKSVFRVSDSPEVHSNGYHIRFDAKSGPMGYILPQWISERLMTEEEDGPRATENKESKEENERSESAEDAQEVLMVDEYEGWRTRIVLPLKEEHQGAAMYSLAARFRDVHPSLLLFLHRLKRIIIQDKASDTRSEMVRRDLGESVMEVSHTNGTDHWLVIKKELDSSKIKEDVEVSELALAFPLLHDTDLDINDALRRRRQAWPQQNVFAYLPLRSYGFRFIIQGDFEVPSSREDVDSDKPWNQWLREAIPQLFIDSLDVFRNHSSFSGFSFVVAYFQFVPLEEEISDFFTPVARHILKLLQGTQCMPVVETNKVNDQTCSRTGESSSSNCKWVLPCKAILCHDSATRELIGPPLLEEHLGLFFLHPTMGSALNPILRSRLGIDTLSSKHLIEIGKAEVKKASTNLASRISWVARWLQCVYRCLEEERDSSQEVLNVIASLGVVPLTDGSFVNLTGDSLFFPLSLKKESGEPVAKRKAASEKKSSGQSNFAILEEDLSTVHPNLFLSLDDIGRSQVEELLRRLGVKSWTPKELINSHILPTLKSDKWKGKSDEVLRSYLLYIHEQRLNDPTVCDVDDLRSCVQILTNKGRCNPSNTPVHFTPKYGNKIDLARNLPSISWTLIDESYLNRTVGVQELTELLTELGVKRFLAINRKQVKLERTTMGQTPWASYVDIWPTTPDRLYLVEDWACDEFEEFVSKVLDSENRRRVSPEESSVLAECIDELWDSQYAKFADDFVPYKDSNGHILGETTSSFYLNLVSKPWMSTDHVGLATSAATFSNASPFFFKPNELFMRTDSVYELLEDHVNYVTAVLKNSAFWSTLGIRVSVDVEALLGEMTQWSCAGETRSEGNQENIFTTSVGHMNKVYSFLLQRLYLSAADKEKVQDAFRKNTLIFIPDCSRKPPGNRQFLGRFYKKKEVCWRDPSGVSAKLFNEHGRKPTRHLLEEHYSKNQWSLSEFFIDVLNVDETPNMDEYIEMASFVSEVAAFPTPSSMDDMFKIFSILGRKCLARGQNDRIRVEIEIDEKMSSYLKQRLEKEERLIFPSLEKWVALSAKPLVPDDKSLQKIFQKEKEVHFLDLDSFLRSPKSRAHDAERKQMQKNVFLFLRCCMIDKLSECVEKRFTPDLVQYQCVPLQKYFHRMVPSVQRFLYYKMEELYSDLKKKGFAQKLSDMKFATVNSLETVYSLRTHPGVNVPVTEKSGVEVVSSSYCFYVAKQHQNDLEVINAEMAKLFFVGQKTSSEFRNFLLAVGNYHGDNLEHFLEEQQGLEPLPEGEELWFVPPPVEPDVVEVEETPSKVFPDLSNAARTHAKPDDNELHSWPPKSSPQFDKVRKSQETSSTVDTLKMWPPPAPPVSSKVDTHGEQIQGNSLQQDNSTTKRPTETERMNIEFERPCQVAPQAEAEGISVGDHMKKPEINPIRGAMASETSNVSFVAADQAFQQVGTCDIQPNVSTLQSPGHEDSRVCPAIYCEQDRTENCLINPAVDLKYPSPFFRFLEDTTLNDPYEELRLNSDILRQSDFGESPNKEEVGRWGEQFVFNFLQSQAKYLPQEEEVEIRWMNETQNTTAPYDFEILRRKTIKTFVEVKSTTSAEKEAFEISVQELFFALEKREAFHLYRVFNAGKPTVRLLRIKNIAAHLERKHLKLCMVI